MKIIRSFVKNRVVFNTLILFIFTLTTELIVRVLTEGSFIEFSMARIILSSFILSLFVSWLGHFLPKVGQRVFNIIYVLFVGIYEFVEFGLYNYIGFFMGVGNAEQGTKITEFIKDFFVGIKAEYYLILIPLGLALIYYLFFDRKVVKGMKRNNVMTFLQKAYIEFVTLVLICLLGGIYYYFATDKAFQNESQTTSNYSLWLYPENSNLAVNNYGVLVYGFCDIKSIITGIDADYIMELEMKNNGSANKKEEKKTDFTRTIDDTAWDMLINETSNGTYKTLNNYFKNRSITDKNDMTGKFKGKNLIVILAESVNEMVMMNQEYFPNYYKMYNEGISFRNNFSPRNNCSTGNNEFTSLSSLFTINNTCTANAYSYNKYPQAVFNIFNKAGYYTSAYHNYTEKFYRRSKTLPNLGAQKYMGAPALGIPYSTSYTEADDKDMYEAAKAYYMNEEHFMTYFATVTPHQSYINSQTCSDKYFSKYKSLGYSDMLSRYLSKLQVFDEALGVLLQELESAGKLEDTVIAIFCDHYPYGLSDSQINEYLKKNNSSYTVSRNSTKVKNIDRTPMLIYNAGSEAIKVEKYTTLIDLLPTLLNLFDMDYDPRLYLGTDVFSDTHASRAVFADGSWQNEYGFYYAPNSKMNYYDGVEFKYTNEELKGINNEIVTRQKMSNSAITSNYFKYLGEGLDKYKAELQPQTTEETTTQVVNEG